MSNPQTNLKHVVDAVQATLAAYKIDFHDLVILAEAGEHVDGIYTLSFVENLKVSGTPNPHRRLKRLLKDKFVFNSDVLDDTRVKLVRPTAKINDMDAYLTRRLFGE